MFCWKCGKELFKNAQFCTNCGAPVPTPEVQAAVSETDVQPAVSESEVKPAMPESDVQPAVSESDVQPAVSESDVQPAVLEPAPSTPEITPVQDLIVRKNRLSVTDGKLQVDGTYYRKKGRRYKKKKGQLCIPLSFVKGTAVHHTPCAGKIIATLLLFLIFTAGTVISCYFDRQTWGQLNTPYRQEEIDTLENTLEQLSGISESQLTDLDTQLKAADESYALLESQLAVYQAERQQELMQTAVADSSFDTQALFSSDFFAEAYEQYLEDLLEAFLTDNRIHDWLYPYYAYSLEMAGNKYIEDEMPFYAPPNSLYLFSAETKDPKAFLQDAYNYDLYKHIYYTGRIYITASDFMNRVLNIPNYAVNGAVFVKAYGGIPNPADLYVPGWTNGDYTAFWQNAPKRSSSAEPVWLSYGLSAEEFNLDWEQLADEQAFYNAYLKFMNTIAPGLGVFDMVTYSAGDDSYGGMYYDITGKEASVTEIVTLYIVEHPEYFEEQNIDLETLPSSYDRQMEAAQQEMDELTAQINDLTSQRSELAAFLDSEESLRAEYDQLLEEVQDHRNLLLKNLIIFSGIFILLLLMVLVSLIVFIRLVRKPNHVMILTLEDDTEAAFSIRFCSKKKLAALQERLPTAPAGPHT